MKKYILSLIVIAFTFSSCEKTKTIEMMKDSNVEAATHEWFIFANNSEGKIPEDFLYDKTTEESYSPTHSIKMWKLTIDTDTLAGVGQAFTENLPLNKDLTLSAMIKGKDLIGVGASIVIRCDDVSGNLLQIESTELNTPIKGTFDWKQFQISLANVSSKTTDIYVFLVYQTGTTGTVYFDDIHLTYEEK